MSESSESCVLFRFMQCKRYKTYFELVPLGVIKRHLLEMGGQWVGYMDGLKGLLV